jgi:hypothetical protein
MAPKVVSKIVEIAVIASGNSLRERHRLRAFYGGRRWRNLKGVARVELPSGETALAEVHWYEAHGVGPRELKLKRLI